MVTSSFYHKAELERYIIDQISDADYVELVDAMYEPMLNSNLSFLAKTGSGKIVGVAINFDAWDEPEIEIHSKLSVIWEFLDFVEIPVKYEYNPSFVINVYTEHVFSESRNCRKVKAKFCILA